MLVIFSPYSLGKLIEWKQQVKFCIVLRIVIVTPYSLGKLIEWKHQFT
jgi:hypothetical protein